jgi:hypothetical protein
MYSKGGGGQGGEEPFILWKGRPPHTKGRNARILQI